MDKHWAYCSACDRQVEVAVDPTGGLDPMTGDPVKALVCLEVGHTCTGALCPITDATPDEMREALESLRAQQRDSKAEE
ncbi:MAG: hypothetical protein KJO06_04080 [Gemmatimonadetes bacterium]|nr:hypothetical protein [Gemmatimonadota bacterium]